MPNKTQITQVGGDWRNKYKWDWYATLAFNKPVTKRYAIQQFNLWECQLSKVSGCQIQHVIVIPSRGFIQGLHVLLSGAGNEKPDYWQQKWGTTNGEAKIIRYLPGLGADHYISRKLTDNKVQVIFSQGY
jgi:hypothetical protein